MVSCALTSTHASKEFKVPCLLWPHMPASQQEIYDDKVAVVLEPICARDELCYPLHWHPFKGVHLAILRMRQQSHTLLDARFPLALPRITNLTELVCILRGDGAECSAAHILGTRAERFRIFALSRWQMHMRMQAGRARQEQEKNYICSSRLGLIRGEIIRPEDPANQSSP